ncbi:uncharacterized protein LOC143602470 [Bidens hawaiensis]|uniref:uncharacterized protein LOC143602470 n=1 Tax=Bidens hawaiensis TaxID=980011 RepID=UPI00404A301B
MKECHDSLWAGHPGVKRTMEIIECTFYWSRLKDDVEAYVRTCLVCQQDKIEKRQPGGLLEHLPIPKGPWESISMDFITCRPKSEGSGSIIVVVDRFSKYGTFIPAPADVTVAETARLFFKHVVMYWGIPHVIVSDRDPRFTGKFWCELFKIMGTDLNFSTSFHPQTDGQTKRDWAKLPTVAQFSTSYKSLKEWHEQADLARASLNKAAKKMKKWADDKRRHIEFQVGDQVMVKLVPKSVQSEEEHARHLREVLKVMRKEKLFAKYREGGSSDEVGTSQISDRDSRFLGLAGYYWRFIQNFSSIASSLTKLTKKGVKYVWGVDQEKAFQELKGRLTHATKQLGSLDVVVANTEKLDKIKAFMKATQDRQKPYADKRRRPIEFEEGDRVMLKVSPWKGIIRFRNMGKLSPRFIGPFRILKRVGEVAYRKCLADGEVPVPLDDIELEAEWNYVEQPIAILDRKEKHLRTGRRHY